MQAALLGLEGDVEMNIGDTGVSDILNPIYRVMINDKGG